MSEQHSEKTEQPTSRRLEKARREGQVARSREVATLAAFLAVLIIGALSGKSMVLEALEAFKELLKINPAILQAKANPVGIIMDKSMDVFGAIMPLLLGLAFFAILFGVLQTRGNIAPKAVEAKWEKIDPIKGFKNIFMSIGTLGNTAVNIFKTVVIGFIVYKVAVRLVPEVPLWSYETPLAGVFSLFSALGEIMLYVTLAMIFIAIADYAFQWYRQNKQLMMSQQEIKDENKESEGDPHFKGRQRAKMREMSLNRMITDVPKADVVVVNPTHYAVALRYDRAQDPAPRVLAKGKGFFAKRIREIAKENGVPIMSNPPFARAVFRSVKIGKVIPEDLYRIAASILAEVYRMRQGRPHAARSAHR